jgi:hypothetical protein
MVAAKPKTPAVMREIYKTLQPIQRAGLPDDIADAAVFLASEESSFINGIIEMPTASSSTARARERICHSASAYIAVSACGWLASFGSFGKRC